MVTSGGNRGKRPKLVPLSEELRRMFGLLAEELARWPGVSVRPIFGLRAFYRGSAIFALIPEKRGLESARAIAYKEGGKWKLLELDSDRDLARALVGFDKAYTNAAPVGPPPKKVSFD